MQYDILELNTHSALEIASDLNILTVEDPFTFYANMKWVRPFGMLYTACTIKRFREKFAHIPFFLEYATSREGISYAAHMGFFKAISGKIDIGKEPGEAIGNNNYIPITELDLNQMHREDIISGKNVEMGDTIPENGKNIISFKKPIKFYRSIHLEKEIQHCRLLQIRINGLNDQCVKNATKTKIGLRAHPLAGLFLSTLNIAFREFVALSHVLKNELKWNPLKSRLFRQCHQLKGKEADRKDLRSVFL
jgi:hypothetical protein